MVVFHDGGPTALNLAFEVLNGSREGAMGRHVSGSGPIKLMAKAGGVA